MIKNILEKKNLSIYKCSKISEIPYSTLIDLVNNKTKFKNCSIKTISKLSKALDIPISELINLEYSSSTNM